MGAVGTCDWCGKKMSASNINSGDYCSKKCKSTHEKSKQVEKSWKEQPEKRTQYLKQNEQDAWQVLNDPNREWDIAGGCAKFLKAAIIILAIAVAIGLIFGK